MLRVVLLVAYFHAPYGSLFVILKHLLVLFVIFVGIQRVTFFLPFLLLEQVFYESVVDEGHQVTLKLALVVDGVGLLDRNVGVLELFLLRNNHLYF